MEMRNRQVNHARNIWDQAVTILPRANQFWYKYTYMEEMVGNVAGKLTNDEIIDNNYYLKGSYSSITVIQVPDWYSKDGWSGNQKNRLG